MERKWEQPRLIILIKNKPAESILMGCKRFGMPMSSASHNFGCDVTTLAPCVGCAQLTGS